MPRGGVHVARLLRAPRFNLHFCRQHEVAEYADTKLARSLQMKPGFFAFTIQSAEIMPRAGPTHEDSVPDDGLRHADAVVGAYQVRIAAARLKLKRYAMLPSQLAPERSARGIRLREPLVGDPLANRIERVLHQLAHRLDGVGIQRRARKQ